MKHLRRWLHSIIWAIWMNLNQPEWLTPAVEWITDLRIRKDNFG
jgi:hypothetical protein